MRCLRQREARGHARVELGWIEDCFHIVSIDVLDTITFDGIRHEVMRELHHAGREANDQRRQVQFATPGGTRIIWVFDSNFNVR